MTIPWRSFDADKPNPEMEGELRKLEQCILDRHSVDPKDEDAVRRFATEQIKAFKAGHSEWLNDTFMLNVFSPHEFDNDRTNDRSLLALEFFLGNAKFNWREGSKTVVTALNSLPSAGSKRLAGGREYVELDALIVIERRRVAIEVETSKNMDNGYWTIRMALRSGAADYGAMVVPWTADREGRAEEGKALGRLDREFDGQTGIDHGPIFRIAIIRGLDLCRRMQK